MLLNKFPSSELHGTRSCPTLVHVIRADSRLAPSHWETALLCNDVSHWLGANLESALCPSTGPSWTNFNEMWTTYYNYYTHKKMQWISKLPRSFEIHWVRQYIVNFTDLMGIVNATVYKTEPTFTSLGDHPGMANYPNVYHCAFQDIYAALG